MGYHEAAAELETNTQIPAPRIRLNIQSNLVLTTSWQTLDFAGTSTLNTNTYPMGPDGTNKYVYWDTTNKQFMFQAPSDRNYTVTFNTKISSSALISALNLTMATAQLRFVVPSPTPIYFPLPDSDQATDISNIGLTSVVRNSYVLPIYANSVMRQYGLKLQMQISNTFLGGANATLNAADIIITGQ